MSTIDTDKAIKEHINEEAKLIEAPTWEDIKTPEIDYIELSKSEKQYKSEDDNNSCGFIISTAKDLINYEIQPEFFIVNPLIPKEAITAITADSGKGKSLLALIIACQIAKGEKIFGEYEVEKTNVLMIDQEMNKNEIASRFQKVAGNNIDEIENLDYIINQDFKIDNLLDFKNLLLLIKQNGYGLIIFDTFTEIHSGEENDSGQMKKINSKLKELIQETGISIIYLHHHRKSQKGEKLSQSSSRGSTEIIAKVSSHLLIDSKNIIDEDENNVLEVTLSQEKARSAKRLNGKIKLKIINTDEKITSEFLGELEERTEMITKAKDAILEMLKESQGLTVEDVKEKTGIGKNNIRAAFKELLDSKILDVGKRGRSNYYFPATPD